jgi:uncharacterized OsmC-like protein
MTQTERFTFPGAGGSEPAGWLGPPEDQATTLISRGSVYIEEDAVRPAARSSWSCTSMTLRMYADRHGYSRDHIAVRLAHRRSHSDCADAPGKRCTVERIDRQIWLTGRLDEVQRSRLIEIADPCPIHRTIRGEVRISTTIQARDHGQNATLPKSLRATLGSQGTQNGNAGSSTRPFGRTIGGDDEPVAS